MKEQINLGKWRIEHINHVLRESSEITDPGERIAFLAQQFLDTSYRESTLIGNVNIPEVLVINLEGMDCFTLLDYVEAMRRSSSFAEFRENLLMVRYKSGEVAFEKRNHFFTDWKAFNSNFIVDVTNLVGGEITRRISKNLNRKDNGKLLIPEVSCRSRELLYIPAAYLDDTVTAKLKNGDYIGIYSKSQGLDVSHVGIVIKRQHNVCIVHASSLKKHRKVVKEDFSSYIYGKPGFVVFRARD